MGMTPATPLRGRLLDAAHARGEHVARPQADCVRCPVRRVLPARDETGWVRA